MQRRQHTIFTTVRSEGAILPADLLTRIATLDPNLPGLTPDSYNLLKSEKLNEAINRSWNRLLNAWGTFKSSREKLPEKDAGTIAEKKYKQELKDLKFQLSKVLAKPIQPKP